MKKQVIRLTESDLHSIVKESANKILKELVNVKKDESPIYNGEENEVAIYRHLISIFDEIANNLKNNGITDNNVIMNILMPLQHEIKLHERY